MATDMRSGPRPSMHPLDPAIGIAWPASLPAILSDKDAAAPALAEARAAGLLPAYQNCLPHEAAAHDV